MLTSVEPMNEIDLLSNFASSTLTVIIPLVRAHKVLIVSNSSNFLIASYFCIFLYNNTFISQFFRTIHLFCILAIRCLVPEALINCVSFRDLLRHSRSIMLSPPLTVSIFQNRSFYPINGFSRAEVPNHRDWSRYR